MPNLSWVELARGFAGQSEFSAGYSPLYEAIFAYCAEILRRHVAGQRLDADERALVDLLETEWSGRTLQSVIEATLLLLGGMHSAVLNGELPALERFYATVGGSYRPEIDRDALRQALGGVFLKPPETLRTFLRSGEVQTNEVSRGMTWLLPAVVLGTWAKNLPISLIDLGCSAGLNLAADEQTWRWTAADGDRCLGHGDPLISQQLDFGDVEPSVREALPPGALPRPHVLRRVGIDRNPLRLDNPADVATLRACIWGDQPDRLERLDRAIEGYRHLEPPPEIVKADAVEAARTLHTLAAPGTRLLLVYNTWVTSYMDDAEYAALAANMMSSFAQLSPGVCGLWLELEAVRRGEPKPPDKLCPLKAHVLIDGVLSTRILAHCEPHPQTITLLPGWENFAL